jgi:hypothetical protein
VLADRYRLDALIAAGGVGEVWQGTDLALDRRVAVKVLRPEHARDEDGLARFRAEAHHAGSLSHPNIAHVYDFCAERPPDPGFLVMELVDGPSLARALDGGPLEPAAVMGIIAQAARGLAAAHRAGLIHRDIKPGNLLIGADGEVKVTDFGIAQAAGAEPVTRTGTLIGTPAYLAPERGAGRPATPASDLYSLGVVAHQCLTGQLPFQGPPLAVVIAHMEEPLPPLPPSVPAPVVALVDALTSKNPLERPASAGDVAVRADQLRAALAGPPAPPAGWFPEGSRGPAAPVEVAPVEVAPVAVALDPGSPGWADPDRSPLLRLPARAAMVLSAAGAAGLLGWTLLTPGTGPAARPALSRPAATRPAPSHPSLARRQGHPSAGAPGQMSPAAAVAPERVTSRATRAARAAASPSAPVPSAAPTPAAAPSGTASASPVPSAPATPTAAAPSGSPTVSPAPTPSGSTAAGGAATSGPGAGPHGGGSASGGPTGAGTAPALTGTAQPLPPGGAAPG